MNKQEFAYVWEYRVKVDAIPDFLEAYGADGDWVRLFTGSKGFLRTELLFDERDPQRFLTIDRWESRSDRDSFRERCSAEYEELDGRCGALTESERFVGDFVVNAGKQTN